MKNWNRLVLILTSILVLGVVAQAKKPTALDKAVAHTFKENRELQKAYYGKLVTEKKSAKAARKLVVEDVPVELGSDIPDLDYVPANSLSNE